MKHTFLQYILLYKFFPVSPRESVMFSNFSLASCRLAFVGALTERPCSEMLRIRRKWGEMVGLYRRAINDRPYYIIDTLFDKQQSQTLNLLK